MLPKCDAFFFAPAIQDLFRLRRDAGWIDLYGREAYDVAVRSTEWVLSLPYPPPSPQRGDDGEELPMEQQELAVRAAWGGPELWPAHRAACPTVGESTRLRTAARSGSAAPTSRR